MADTFPWQNEVFKLCIVCYFKVIDGQVSLSTLLGTLRVYINSSFFGYFDGLERSTFQEL